MARKTDVAVIIKPEADFGQARRDIATNFRGIEKDAKATVATIERVVDGADLAPKVDLDGLNKADTAFKDFAARLESRGVDVQVNDAELRQAFDIAEKLKNATARLNIDTDADELKEVERLAQSLRNFTGRVRLDVEGRQDLRESLGLAEQLDQIRQVKVDVQGRQDLERANQLADDLERRRQINIDPPPPSAFDRIDQQVGEHGESAGGLFAEKFADVDFGNVGGTVGNQIAGGLAAAGPWAAAAGAAAAIFGDDFAEGFNDSWNSRRDDTIRQLSSGLDVQGMRDVGEAAGAAFADGLGESLGELKDTAAILRFELGQVDDSLNLTDATKEAEYLSKVFGIEIPESTKLARRLIANGLAPDAVAAFNLIGQAAGDFGVEAQDGLEVVNEFAPVFGRLGVDGAQAMKIMAAEVRQGLIPTIDRAAEQFQEFNIRLQAGDSRDAIQAIGLDFDKLQEKAAKGLGADALAAVGQRLADIGNTAERNRRFVEIFGASVEDVTDPQQVSELLATANAVGEIGTNATDGAKKLAETQTSFDKLKRSATELGGIVAQGLDFGLARQSGDFEHANQVLGDMIAPVEKLITGSNQLADGMRGVGESLGGSGGANFEMEIAQETTAGLNDAIDAGTSRWIKHGDAAKDVGGAFEKVAKDANELRTQLDGIFNFGADQLLRDIQAAGDDLAETFKENGRAAIGMNGAIDITKKGGVELQEGFERLSGALVDAAVKFKDGQITADQFRAVQAAVEGQLGRTTSAAGVTTDKVEGLRHKYTQIPTSITTSLNAVDNASGTVTRLQAYLAQIKDKTVTITGRVSGFTGLSANATFRARGGPASGLTVVGEEGPELVDFKGNAYVYTATETKRLLANMGRPGTSTSEQGTTAVNGSPLIGNATIMVSPGRDLWQELRQAEAVYSAGLY